MNLAFDSFASNLKHELLGRVRIPIHNGEIVPQLREPPANRSADAAGPTGHDGCLSDVHVTACRTNEGAYQWNRPAKQGNRIFLRSAGVAQDFVKILFGFDVVLKRLRRTHAPRSFRRNNRKANHIDGVGLVGDLQEVAPRG